MAKATTKTTAKKTTAKKAPATKAAKSALSFSPQQKLKALYDLQNFDSEIDKIRTVRGELPLEVQDLEDDIEGLQTRVGKFNDELEALEQEIANRKIQIKESKAAMKKYEKQQDNVRNNREYDSLTKEIEFQNLEVQLAEKKINEFAANVEALTSWDSTMNRSSTSTLVARRP